jgi:hypothetical protein
MKLGVHYAHHHAAAAAAGSLHALSIAPAIRYASTKAHLRTPTPKSNLSTKNTGVFPQLLKGNRAQPRRSTLSAIQLERSRSSRIQVSYWEAAHFEQLLVGKLYKSLEKLYRRPPAQEEMRTAYEAVTLVRHQPNAHIGESGYARVIHAVVEEAERPWTPDLRREVREGGRQLRLKTYRERLTRALLVVALAGSLGYGIHFNSIGLHLYYLNSRWLTFDVWSRVKQSVLSHFPQESLTDSDSSPSTLGNTIDASPVGHTLQTTTLPNTVNAS